MNDKAFSVIYIAGAGRSGSTSFDIVLGDQNNVCATGELVNLVNSTLCGEYCSCGSMLSECSHWSLILDEWSSHLKLSKQDLIEFADSDRFFSHPGKLSAWISALSLFESSRYRVYLVQLKALYTVISEVTGNDIITDSSKSPVRLLNIAKAVGPESLTVVHLVRELGDVVLSLAKPIPKNLHAGVQQDLPGRPMLRTALWWVVVNLMSKFSISIIDVSKTIAVRYESFLSDPNREVRRINDNFSVKESIVIKHVAAGNRMRMSKLFRLMDYKKQPRPEFFMSKAFYRISRYF